MKINKFFNLKTFSMAEGGQGGGSEGDPAAELAALQTRLDDAMGSIAKLETKNGEVIGDNKALKDAAKQWGDLDPDNVKSLMDKFNNDEDMRLIAEGKHSEVIAKQVEKASMAFQSQINELTESSTSYKEKLDTANGKISDLLINSQVTSEFSEIGGIPGAASDAVYRAKQLFGIEDGEAVARDGDKKAIVGKDGGLTIKEFVASLKETAPHLFPGSQGAGAHGDGGGGGSELQNQLSKAYEQGNIGEIRRIKAEIKESNKK